MKKRFFGLLVLSFLISSCGEPVFSNLSGESYSFSSVESVLSESLGNSNSSSEDDSKESFSTISSIDYSSIDDSSESTPNYSSFSSYSSGIIDEDKWDMDLTLRGETFRNALKAQIDKKRKKTTDYKSCLSIGANAARYPNDSSVRFVPFYHSIKTLTTTSSCNREHTWPNSRGTGQSGPGADPFIIRPTITSDNSSRGNYFYGLGGKNNYEWDPASIEFEGARGEAARVILYAATAYYTTLSLSNNPMDDTSLKTMGTLKYLIRWNNQYEPTEIEKLINDRLDASGYGRNPFVDHPEYANYIWSENGLLDAEGTDNTATYNYDLVDALEDIDGASLIICSTDSNGTPVALSTNAKSDTLPWYISGISCSFSQDYAVMSTTYENVPKFTFRKETNNFYTIYNSSIDSYLFHYIDESHYSIGLGKSPTNDGSIYWNISKKDEMSFIFYGEKEVYLEYYRGSFCGYSNEPSIGIYLFR